MVLAETADSHATPGGFRGTALFNRSRGIASRFLGLLERNRHLVNEVRSFPEARGVSSHSAGVMFEAHRRGARPRGPGSRPSRSPRTRRAPHLGRILR
jgi:hypothetical protein